MAIPYRARVDERWFLNLPGWHGGAYVVAYVEDTSDRHPYRDEWHQDDCPDCPHNFEPRIILEIADCDRRINLQFDLVSEAERENSLHKLDTLVAALKVFRTGLEEEFHEYDRRARELQQANE